MKVHLLWKKEEIDEAQMWDNKIAVVFDVLLATSAITSCLASGAEQVIPVLNETEALQKAKAWNDGARSNVLLAGEEDGLTISGFLDPVPSVLNKQVAGRTVILSTTNGTVAIRKAASAKKVYMASLLNGKAVAKQIKETYENETIVVVCSGSKNEFCLEDFYGAGYFIASLAHQFGYGKVDLTDSALSAMMFYDHFPDQADSVLKQSRVGRMLSNNGFSHEIAYVSQQGVLDVIPRLNAAATSVTEELRKHITIAERSGHE
ncbi:2-phosphosulfolactate phosphatase [Lentibacillus halodurans]|uniref:Probable 2-phosphosulfolactate phosphatase n=1 Tax=Lentibacillus halodurans TaxID=237679 RepID=A0A1I0YGG2_9BACI|nr:2-phosphosulfolactate phosphatase [Lentibacillus halodurans]SFB11947.1 2-phosphosulfolactate phosphatase [Lentibacillus halodurans]